MNYKNLHVKNLIEERQLAHEMDRQRQAAALEAARKENGRLRSQRLQKVEAERNASREQAIEARLADEKQRIKNQWLADHPNETDSDFEQKAWKYIKQNLIAEREQKIVQAEIEAARTSGRYSF